MSCYWHQCECKSMYIHLILSYIIGANILSRYVVLCCVVACYSWQRCCWPIVHVESWSPLGCRAPRPAPPPGGGGVVSAPCSLIEGPRIPPIPPRPGPAWCVMNEISSVASYLSQISHITLHSLICLSVGKSAYLVIQNSALRYIIAHWSTVNFRKLLVFDNLHGWEKTIIEDIILQVSKAKEDIILQVKQKRTEGIRYRRLGLVPSHSGLLRLTPSLLFGHNALKSPSRLLSFKYCAVCARSRHESESENRWNSRSAKTIRFPNSHELIWLFSWAAHKVYFFSPNHSVQQLRAFWRKIWPHICFQNIVHFWLQLWMFLNCFWHKECNIQNSLINDRGNIKTPLFINNKCNNWNLLKYRSTTLYIFIFWRFKLTSRH